MHSEVLESIQSKGKEDHEAKKMKRSICRRYTTAQVRVCVSKETYHISKTDQKETQKRPKETY